MQCTPSARQYSLNSWILFIPELYSLLQLFLTVCTKILITHYCYQKLEFSGTVIIKKLKIQIFIWIFILKKKNYEKIVFYKSHRGSIKISVNFSQRMFIFKSFWHVSLGTSKMVIILSFRVNFFTVTVYVQNDLPIEKLTHYNFYMKNSKWRRTGTGKKFIVDCSGHFSLVLVLEENTTAEVFFLLYWKFLSMLHAS